LQTLLVDDFLAKNTRMDGVVTVVDAAHAAATLDAQFEAVSQAAMADLIVLSKTDLVNPADVESLETRLYGLKSWHNHHPIHLGKGFVWKIMGVKARFTTTQQSSKL
jgi:G3E family GTPase